MECEAGRTFALVLRWFAFYIKSCMEEFVDSYLKLLTFDGILSFHSHLNLNFKISLHMILISSTKV